MRAGAFTLAVLVVCLHLSATGAKKRAHKAAHAHHADAKKAHKGVGGMMKFKMAEGVPAPGSAASTQPLAAVGDALEGSTKGSAGSGRAVDGSAMRFTERSVNIMGKGKGSAKKPSLGNPMRFEEVCEFFTGVRRRGAGGGSVWREHVDVHARIR